MEKANDDDSSSHHPGNPREDIPDHMIIPPSLFERTKCQDKDELHTMSSRIEEDKTALFRSLSDQMIEEALQFCQYDEDSTTTITTDDTTDDASSDDNSLDSSFESTDNNNNNNNNKNYWDVLEDNNLSTHGVGERTDDGRGPR